MHTTNHRRTRRLRRAVAVAALLPVLALAACNGDNSGDDDKASKDPSASPSPDDDQGDDQSENSGGDGGENDGGNPGGDGTDTGGNGGGGADSGTPPLSQSQLDQATLTEDDLPDWRVQEDEIISDDVLVADETACQPIVDLLNPRPARARTAEAQVAAFARNDAQRPRALGTVLAAYAPGDAERVLAELREAVPRCGSFRVSTDGDAPEESRVTASPEQVSAGDDTFTFDLDQAEEDASRYRITVVRTGQNTATFLSVVRGNGEPPTVDQAVARRQHDKLVAAAGS